MLVQELEISAAQVFPKTRELKIIKELGASMNQVSASVGSKLTVTEELLLTFRPLWTLASEVASPSSDEYRFAARPFTICLQSSLCRALAGPRWRRRPCCHHLRSRSRVRKDRTSLIHEASARSRMGLSCLLNRSNDLLWVEFA